MKTSIKTLIALASVISVSAFAPSANVQSRNALSTQRNMFSGAGAAAPKEDDEGKLAEMEKMAQAMGMSLEEYQLGMNARMRMEEDINNIRLSAGDDNVKVERDGNSPPRHLEITITDEGKAMGKDALEAKLVEILKDASEQSKKGREQAQQKMMQYIGEQMKNMAGGQ